VNQMEYESAYQMYCIDEDYKEAMRILNESYMMIDGKPMLICGDAKLINLNDKDIKKIKGLYVCANKSCRKWREFNDIEHIDGTSGEHYIMTYEDLVYTFGEDKAKIIFDKGEVEEWMI